MKIITIQIGNSDNALTQQDWATFCSQIHNTIKNLSEIVHFSGPSIGWDTWQNAAWIFQIKSTAITKLKNNIKKIRSKFNQDSVAWTEGNTTFI